VLESLEASDAFELAVFSGSAAVGLGHANSDVDVHVVLKPGARLERRSFDQDGHRVQLQIVDPEHLARMVDLAEAYRVTRDDRSQSELTNVELWHLIRLATGEVLWASDGSRRLLDRMSFDVVRQVVAANYAHPAARACQTTGGMLRRGQATAACHTSTVAMTAACEVALAATGDVYAVNRFLAARLERASVLKPAFAQIWELLHCLPRAEEGSAALAAAARARVFAAAGIVAHSLLYGWETVLADLPPLAPVDAGGPVRAPDVGLLRFADAFGLAGRTRSLRIGTAVAAVWAAADGSPVEGIVERLRSHGHDATHESVTQALDALAQANAVSYDGESADTAREEVTRGPSVGDRGR
jgi:hypothetical protein